MTSFTHPKPYTDWLVIAFGFTTISVVLVFCLWRILILTDNISKRDQVVARVLENQAIIIERQKEILSILQKYR